jgi:hypothetical protein
LANTSVKMLALNNQPWIEDLSYLGLPGITHLSLDNLSRIRSLSALVQWPVLEMLGLRQARPSAGDLATVCQSSSLRHLTIGQSVSRRELTDIKDHFRGDSLRYSGSTLRGDPPSGVIVSNIDL